MSDGNVSFNSSQTYVSLTGTDASGNKLNVVAQQDGGKIEWFRVNDDGTMTAEDPKDLEKASLSVTSLSTNDQVDLLEQVIGGLSGLQEGVSLTISPTALMGLTSDQLQSLGTALASATGLDPTSLSTAEGFITAAQNIQSMIAAYQTAATGSGGFNETQLMLQLAIVMIALFAELEKAQQEASVGALDNMLQAAQAAYNQAISAAKDALIGGVVQGACQVLAGVISCVGACKMAYCKDPAATGTASGTSGAGSAAGKAGKGWTPDSIRVMTEGISQALNGVGTLVKAIMDNQSALGNALSQFYSNMINVLKTALDALAQFEQTVDEALKKLLEILNSIRQSLTEAAKEAAQNA